MGIKEKEEENGCKGVKRKKPLDIDWEHIVPTSSDDDDRPPELVMTSNDGGGDVALELELMMKSVREIRETIARLKNLKKIAKYLPDNGEKLKKNLRRLEDELERRMKLQSDKADKGCEEAIQISDHSDDGASCGKKKRDQESLSFARRCFCKSQSGVATNALIADASTEHDALTDTKMQKIVNELVNVGISETDVGKAAEVCYNDPVKVKVLFALPSNLRRFYVCGFLQN